METGLGVLIFLLGCIIGYLICAWRIKCVPVGTLRITHSDESAQPYLFVELNRPIETFETKDYIIMQVKQEYYSSQD